MSGTAKAPSSVPGNGGQPKISQAERRRPSAAIWVLTVVTGAALAITVAAVSGRFGVAQQPDLLASIGDLPQLRSRSVGHLDGDMNGSNPDDATLSRPGPGPMDRLGRGSALMGSPDEPFPPIDDAWQAQPVRAVRSTGGLILPVVESNDDHWRVLTACENTVRLNHDDGEPIGPAHIVLDPGHGGRQPGAVGVGGLTEKEVNSQVVRLARDRLEAMGASVVLTLEFDHDMTTKARGRIAEAVDPALFVSVHHNGGGSPGGEVPGTMALTKAGSRHATRFGGLFYQAMQPVAEAAATQRRAAYSDYLNLLDAYESAVDAYDRSLVDQQAALVSNGQLDPLTTTVPSPRPTGSPPEPRQRAPRSTTTVPATASTTVAVPSTLTPPPPFSVDPVKPFSFAGSTNRGVRAWTRVDGQDYLSVLRNSGDVPAVLVEYLYLSNPAEESLLRDPEFVAAQADALVSAIVAFFSTAERGSGFVPDDHDDQPVTSGGPPDGCVEPELTAKPAAGNGGESGR